MAPDTTSDEIAFEFLPEFRAYKDGRVERFFGTDHVSPGKDAATRTLSKDVFIAPGVSARLFKPDIISVDKRLPVVIYYHGGGWCFGSAFCPTYHNHMNDVVAKGGGIVASVEYRLAPEHPLPIAYEDSWEALKWVASHSDEQGPEGWLNDHADLLRVFVAGDSAGGNIAHNMALQVGLEELPPGFKLVGACLVQPGFTDKEGQFHLIWNYAFPTTTGFDDVRVNPSKDPRLSKLGCSKILVFVAENDFCKDGGLFYCETILKSGWGGTAELIVSPGEVHVFHLFNTTCENAIALLEKMVSFFNQE